MVRIISPDDMHSENIWFSWYKLSNYQKQLRCHACDTRGMNERTEESEKQGSILVDPKPQKGAKRSTK